MGTGDGVHAADLRRIYIPSVALSIFVAALVSFACNLDKFIYPPIIPLVVRDVHLSFAHVTGNCVFMRRNRPKTKPPPS
jgi:hypothetical protein